jgi:hypothetical protein
MLSLDREKTLKFIAFASISFFAAIYCSTQQDSKAVAFSPCFIAGGCRFKHEPGEFT